MFQLRSFILISILIFQVSCVNNPNYRSLEQDSKKLSSSSSTDNKVQRLDYHVVKKGETLYSIALINDLDYRKLATANRIDDSFTIVPGQKLMLSYSSSTQPTLPNTANVDEKTSKPTTQQPIKAEQTLVPKDNVGWAWPIASTKVRASGGVVRQLKGIDIKAQFGEPVIAAADGRVVFAGSGLRGYGNLVIIQHSGEFLSAYAYTSEILVKEKQEVKLGEQVAKVGSTGALNYSALHFEIRHLGKPQDPISLLPLLNN